MAESRKTILIIDDDSMMRRLVHFRLVKHFGYRIVEAESGTMGLKIAKSERPDAILLDWKMPNMDGLEVISKLRAEPKTAGIPVIMLTGKTLFGDMEDALAAGADGYVTKPVELGSLSRQINDALA